ncbi:uncharacterized protein LOC123259867 [Cotesia glomerata]|uniref:Kinetochore protein SPC25 n=1 Tax=Cotesia glomerata TaxID=32391 RepID=A0AAV7HZJ8_COTGL|nr:uncharacterized protein LOC123259867 [Cotesia glomerata]XP_044576576.1 uncharacterized protein LOC123259867 [Cotesia glomerata]XP_044576577.1 uncharacterized protein LOC123259867 [Cotesia glomerata]KAH0539725.1 hypothetical protein KQX54_007624 [Cotesia glomerata]
MASSEFEMTDVESILMSRENEDLMFQRLSEMMVESRTKAQTLITHYVNKQKAIQNKIKTNHETINQLQHQSKDLERQLQEWDLEQKVLQKKINNNNKSIDQLKEEIALEKNKKEELTLELVDLETDQETLKNEKIKNYDALKRALGLYKEKLNIHFMVEILEDFDRVKITYFQKENPKKDYYCIQLLNYNNIIWKVESIVPELDSKHLEYLNLDFTKDYEIQEINKLIPKLRHLFVEHYLSP